MRPKFTTLVFFVGLGLGLGPWLLLEEPNIWWYIPSVLGGVLVAIAGYDAQAQMIGQGEPGEELLQRGWRWFKQHVLRMRVEPPPLLDPMFEPHASVVPRPPRSTLSNVVLMLGLVMALIPYYVLADLPQWARYVLIGAGSLLIVVSRKNAPPRDKSDPPHGREMVQVLWERITGRTNDK